LYETFHALGPDVMELHYFPFGNTKLDPQAHAIVCQHGEAECDANTWEQCAVEHVPPTVYMEFLNCLEESLPMGHYNTSFPESLFLDCAKEATGLDIEALKKCHDNPMLRWQLQEKYGKATPEHSRIPWIVVNGKRIDDVKDDLRRVVCDEYIAGGGTASVCAAYSSSSASSVMEWN
jgi:interferon gamma-inducible protein 30